MRDGDGGGVLKRWSLLLVEVELTWGRGGSVCLLFRTGLGGLLAGGKVAPAVNRLSLAQMWSVCLACLPLFLSFSLSLLTFLPFHSLNLGLYCKPPTPVFTIDLT